MKTLLQFDGCRFDVTGKVCENEIRVARGKSQYKVCATF